MRYRQNYIGQYAGWAEAVCICVYVSVYRKYVSEYVGKIL